MRLVGCVILAIAVASGQAGAEIDVELRLLVLHTPSGVETTPDLSTLPGQTCVAEVNDSFVLELWVSDVGSVNTGLLGFYTDLAFENALVRAEALVHSSLFGIFLEGDIDNGAGQVIDFGGIDGTFTGQGVAPEWAKIGHVEMTAIGEGVATITSSPGIGGVGVYGRQPPPVSEIQFGTAAVGIPYFPGDFDRDCDVDLDDFDQFVACLTGPGGGPVSPQCAPGDFDKDDDIDCDDWPQFRQAWTAPEDPPPLPECSPGVPVAVSYPHNRLRNRYISFKANKTENDARNIAFRVTLKTLMLRSCDAGGSPDVEGWPCRTDDDCRACSDVVPPPNDPPVLACWTAPLHCPPGETCELTGASCVNDQAGSIGMSWWVGPEHPTLGNDVHLLVSEPYRKVSDDWPEVVHAADCEIVPVATYGVRAVNADTAAESDELEVSTIAKPDHCWADCVGPLGMYCTGSWASCPNGDSDCPAGETCLVQWPPPDGFINFQDVTAAAFTFSALPGLTITDVHNLDLHGNEAGDAAIDPPNYAVNFADVADMISAFQGYPYKYNDPGDCPDVATHKRRCCKTLPAGTPTG